ncbi:MAG: hypothetical protein GY751_10310 [Bacteroidetes bacterium]|jgi:hypothetical protein|nr:hypothetical protein [Bacteroidota bacterium]|tara:strand:- start:3993 stop:4292 length:300 start_codon:yes stop_codon:yes gene_type:complete
MSNFVDNTIILLSVGAVGYGLYMIFQDKNSQVVKEAPSGTVDNFQQASFDERTLPFADTVVRNMEARPQANLILNQLYGGVPPVTISDMSSYITGEWIV